MHSCYVVLTHMQLQVSNTIKRGKLIVSVQKVGSILITSRCRILQVIHLPHPVGVAYNTTGSMPSSISLGQILIPQCASAPLKLPACAKVASWSCVIFT